MTRRGVWLFPGVAAAALVEAVVAAEELGLDEVWIADEGVAREPLVVLSAAATRTHRITLAVGITSPVVRHPGAIAASLATLDELSGGRARLGLGVGGHLTLEPFGLGVERPVAVLRDAIDTARDVFNRAGSPRYRVPEHAMPARDVPIWVGARGPQMVRMAANRADGLLISGCPPEQIDAIADLARSVAPIQLALYQTAVDRPTAASELTWERAAVSLADAIARHRPASVGLNLVQLAGRPPVDPVPLVERAAGLLGSL